MVVESRELNRRSRPARDCFTCVAWSRRCVVVAHRRRRSSSPSQRRATVNRASNPHSLSPPPTKPSLGSELASMRATAAAEAEAAATSRDEDDEDEADERTRPVRTRRSAALSRATRSSVAQLLCRRSGRSGGAAGL